MSYIEDFKSVIFGYANDVQKYLSGDKSDYVYCAEESEEWGTFDKNHKNRARLCYALLYDVCEVTDKKGLVRELFLEELTDRETDSFQGIGDNLEMLTSLLLELGEPSASPARVDSELFERAKDANFDCACGYEPCKFDVVPLDEFSLCDCINALYDLNETELMYRFTDEFKSGELNLEGLRELRSIAKWCTKRDEDMEFAVTKIYEIFQKSPELFDKNSANDAVHDYVELLIEKGDSENASLIFNSQEDKLKYYKRNYYKLGAKLIAGGAAAPETIWADILPYIEEDLKINMVAPVNSDIILAAAELANDREMTEKLKDYFDERWSEVHIFRN